MYIIYVFSFLLILQTYLQIYCKLFSVQSGVEKFDADNASSSLSSVCSEPSKAKLCLLVRVSNPIHHSLIHTEHKTHSHTHARTLLLLLHGAKYANFRIEKLKDTWKYQINRIDSSELKLLAMKMKDKWCDYTIFGTRKGPQKQRQRRRRRLSQYRRMFSKATVFFCICFPQKTPTLQATN